MQEEIYYRDIMNLGFHEEFCSDDVYFDEYGYQYTIITKNLTKKIYIDWDKPTRKCKLVRIDKDHNIKAELPIRDLDYLKEIINFFCDEKVPTESKGYVCTSDVISAA